MNVRRPAGPYRPVDLAESDRLLDAARADSRGPDGHRDAAADDPLARLLAAAAAPARPGELAGEEAAVAAFRAARAASPAPEPSRLRRPADAPVLGRRRAGLRAFGRRRATVGAVAWIGALAATATAGVALAAVRLSRPEAPAPPPPVSTPTPTHSLDPAGTPSVPATAGPGHSGGTSHAPTPRGSGHSSADSRLPGLCSAYLSKSARQRQRALDTPGFAPLVAAAGGDDQVEPFCRQLVPEAKEKPAKPGQPGTASDVGAGTGRGIAGDGTAGTGHGTGGERAAGGGSNG